MSVDDIMIVIHRQLTITNRLIYKLCCEHTFDIWTPRLLCMPEHFMQINAPIFEDLIIKRNRSDNVV